jgi:hypothetical protein
MQHNVGNIRAMFNFDMYRRMAKLGTDTHTRTHRHRHIKYNDTDRHRTS